MAERLPPGVVPLEHTADLAIEVRAETLAELFDRAAAGATALLYGADQPGGRGAERSAFGAARRSVRLQASDRAALLLAWIREVLYLHEVTGFVYGGADFHRLSEQELSADAWDREPAGPVEREIKGVTWHGLEVEQEPDGWRARLIFDV